MTTKIGGTNGIEFPDGTIRGSGSLIASNFKNLTANANGLNATVNVAADAVVLENATFSPIIARTVSRAINTATTGVDALDTGTIAASTWYYIWIISDGVNVRGLASLSATAPTMPSGYTYKARVGSFRTDGTANKYPLSFIQAGRRTQYKVAAGSNLTGLPQMASGAQGNVNTPTWIAVSVTPYVPPTSVSIVEAITGTAASGTAMVAPNSSYGPFGSTTNPPPHVFSSGTASRSIVPYIMVLESSNIYFATDISTQLYCLGYEDNF